MIHLAPIPPHIQEKFGSLIDFFIQDGNILFAYLFGGLARGRFSPLSDVDLALFLKKEKKTDYLETFGDITEILGTGEIDLVILNKAPLSLSGRILQSRKVLVDKAPFVRHRYESLTLRMFFDFSIKERDILNRRYGIG
jgi:predicted nucleotidyltransferase